MKLTMQATNWSIWKLDHRLLHLLVGVATSSLSLGNVEARSVTAQAVSDRITVHDGQWTAHLTNTPVTQVVEQIGTLSGAEVRWLGPVMEDSITATFTDTPLPRMLRLILRPRNFLLMYSSAGEGSKLKQIWISPGTGQRDPVDVSAHFHAPPLFGQLENTALHGKSSFLRLQAVKQLQVQARTNVHAKIVLDRIAKLSPDPRVRRAVTQARSK